MMTYTFLGGPYYIYSIIGPEPCSNCCGPCIMGLERVSIEGLAVGVSGLWLL